jgi:predicted permease
VASQFALCLLLLVSAGLLLQTLRRLQHVQLGFEPRQLIAFQVQPGLNGYKDQRLTSYYSELQRRMESLPGVRAVGLAQFGPVGSGTSSSSVVLPGYTEPGKRAVVYRHIVGANYFSALRIPLLLGRTVGEQDTAAAPPVATVNESMVRDYFHGENPIGRTINRGSTVIATIVGVVGDVKYNQIREDAPPTAYFSYLQWPQFANAMTFLVSTEGDPSAVVHSIQKEALSLDKDVPVLNIRTETAVIEQALTLERLFALLSSAFSGFALLLACVGLYGTVGYTVAQRTGEIAIRMALGADRRTILGMVLRESLGIALAGIAVGFPLVWFTTRLLRAQLFHLSPHDPVTMATATVAILVVTIVCSLLPAHRASRVDPMVALRNE